MKLQKYVLGVLVFIILSLSLQQVFALDKISTGFYYPTGTSNLGNYAGWLASGCDGNTAYFEEYYHLGFDIAAAEGDAVYPIAYGKITHKSFFGWGSGNIGIVVKHRLSDGTEFFALYGHVIYF